MPSSIYSWLQQVEMVERELPNLIPSGDISLVYDISNFLRYDDWDTQQLQNGYGFDIARSNRCTPGYYGENQREIWVDLGFGTGPSILHIHRPERGFDTYELHDSFPEHLMQSSPDNEFSCTTWHFVRLRSVCQEGDLARLEKGVQDLYLGLYELLAGSEHAALAGLRTLNRRWRDSWHWTLFYLILHHTHPLLRADGSAAAPFVDKEYPGHFYFRVQPDLRSAVRYYLDMLREVRASLDAEEIDKGDGVSHVGRSRTTQDGDGAEIDKNRADSPAISPNGKGSESGSFDHGSMSRVQLIHACDLVKGILARRLDSRRVLQQNVRLVLGLYESPEEKAEAERKEAAAKDRGTFSYPPGVTPENEQSLYECVYVALENRNIDHDPVREAIESAAKRLEYERLAELIERAMSVLEGLKIKVKSEVALGDRSTDGESAREVTPADRQEVPEEDERLITWEALKEQIANDDELQAEDRVYIGPVLREAEGKEVSSILDALVIEFRKLWELRRSRPQSSKAGGQEEDWEFRETVEYCLRSWYRAFSCLREAEQWFYRTFGPGEDRNLLDDIADSLSDLHYALDMMRCLDVDWRAQLEEDEQNIEESLKYLHEASRSLEDAGPTTDEDVAAGSTDTPKGRARKSKRADRAVGIEKLKKELLKYLKASKDHAYTLRQSGKEVKLLPKPTKKQLAKETGLKPWTVTRCFQDSTELSQLYQDLDDADRILGMGHTIQWRMCPSCKDKHQFYCQEPDCPNHNDSRCEECHLETAHGK